MNQNLLRRKGKTLCSTKLLVTFIFMLFLLPSFSQITVNVQNKTLRQALKEIEKVSNYQFFYNESLDILDKNSSIQLTNSSIDKAMQTLLAGTDVAYEKNDNIIVLVDKGTVDIQKKDNQQDKVTVRGSVLDDAGIPIIGATIIEKDNSAIGTITDIEGNYSISISPFSILQITYVGYKEQEIPIEGKTSLDIILEEDTQTLEEVVVVGYGVQKKINLTGAVSSISGKDISERPVVSTAQALQGVDPSVSITFGTGSPNSDYNIDIRGAISVNGSTPLILADGVEVSLRQVNPNDIESISILKDASASAIYGAKASAGVILITTKKGSDMLGKAKVSYNYRFGTSQNTTSTDFMTNSYDHVSISNKFYKEYQGADMIKVSDDELNMLYERRNDKTEHPDRPWTVVGDDNKYYYYGNFDWHNYFYRKNRPQQEHNLSILGGNEDLQYYVGGRYYNQDGIFKIGSDDFHQYSIRSKIDAKITPWLKYSNNINFESSKYNYPGLSNQGLTITNLQTNISPIFLPQNPDGSTVMYTNQYRANSPLGGSYAALLTEDKAKNSDLTKNFILSNQFDIFLLKGLVLTASHAYKNINTLENHRNMPVTYSREKDVFTSYSSGSIYDYYQEIHRKTDVHNVNIFGTFTYKLGNGHSFNAVTGMQYEDYKYRFLDVRQMDLLSENLDSFAIATGEISVGQSITAFRTLGYFGRINYNYNEKYLLEASIRGDASSRFEKNKRWGLFPSASAGWRMSEEAFWEPLKNVVNSSKFRFSYGSLGNQQVNNYAYIESISTDNSMNYTFDDISKAYYSSVSNPIASDLTWETVTTYNSGIDLTYLDNRLTTTLDLYIRDTKNMLTPSLTLPSVFGAPTPTSNNANLRTKGFEISLRWNDQFKLAGSPLRYELSASLADYETTITKYNNPEKLISDYYVGRKFGEIWGYSIEGLFSTDEEAAEYQQRINDKAVNGRVYSGKMNNYLRAGDIKFLDLNNDNIISQGSGTVENPGDMRIIGNTLPRLPYSFRLNFTWKGIDISSFFQGIGKANWFPTEYAYGVWGPYTGAIVMDIHKDFMNNVWTEENSDAYFPRIRGYASRPPGALGVPSDRYLQDVSYLRFKNLTVGYTFQATKNMFENIRMYVSGENLYYWSKLKKYAPTVDPELANSSATYQNSNGVGYPYSRTITIGVNITF